MNISKDTHMDLWCGVVPYDAADFGIDLIPNKYRASIANINTDI